jgi:hypothetical protein
MIEAPTRGIVLWREERDKETLRITAKWRDALSITLEPIDIKARPTFLREQLLRVRRAKQGAFGKNLAISFELVKFHAHS